MAEKILKINVVFQVLEGFHRIEMDAWYDDFMKCIEYDGRGKLAFFNTQNNILMVFFQMVDSHKRTVSSVRTFVKECVHFFRQLFYCGPATFGPPWWTDMIDTLRNLLIVTIVMYVALKIGDDSRGNRDADCYVPIELLPRPLVFVWDWFSKHTYFPRNDQTLKKSREIVEKAGKDEELGSFLRIKVGCGDKIATYCQ